MKTQPFGTISSVGSCPRETASRLAYPVTLGISLAFVCLLYRSGLPLESVLFAGFFFSLATMALLELALPYRDDWKAGGKDFRVNGFYFLLNGVIDNAGKITVAAVAVYLAPPAEITDPLALAGTTLLALVVGDFCGYCWHRLGHINSMLWRFHGIHHVPTKLYMFMNNTVHFADLFVGSLVSGVPLVVLGFSEEAIALSLFIAGFHSFFAHVNADVRMGRFGYIMLGPEHHRYHHSTKVEESLNFGTATALWDQVFGTFIYRPGECPEQVGVAHPEDFPGEHQLIGSYLSPFTK
ncbi:MAG: sterol desaturase family protein [Gammaproteobacteria bacterium]|nr:sterol desaturase family protein [Gammaproteobacteria bacterium]